MSEYNVLRKIHALNKNRVKWQAGIYTDRNIVMYMGYLTLFVL